MTQVLGVLSAIFWGVLVLSILVFIHEGGHYLAARAFGIRVTEFFLGMPAPWKLSYKSKKYGTEVGITPILLGGYTRICGMEGDEDEALADVLAYVQRNGRVTIPEVAFGLGLEPERAADCLMTLTDWASIAAYTDLNKPKTGRDKDAEKDPLEGYPDYFETLTRDANMLTEYDKAHDFGLDGTTAQGEIRPVDDPEAFLNEERSHTYLGASFIKRVVMLVAGPFVNLVAAFMIVCVAIMAGGVSAVVDVSTVSEVSEGSLAAQAGLVGGDTITRINDTEVSTWVGLCDELDKVLAAGEDFEVAFTHEGVEKVATVEMDGPATMFGVSATLEIYHPDFLTAAKATLAYAAMVGEFALRIITPTKTIETLEQSSSIVGISVMASQAAAMGIVELASLAGAVSMSLGFMNLLPIPPLDGGKILIEIIQLIIRRPLSMKTQAIISYIGLAFFLFIFIFVLRNDIIRYVLGG